MNRDAILATIIGFILGLSITTAILLWPKVTKYLKMDSPQQSNSVTSKTKPTPGITGTKKTDQSPETTFTIDMPLADTIVSENTILVSGKAPANSKLIIGGPADEIAIQVPKDGSYAGKITLIDGQNIISVSKLDKETIETKTVPVYFDGKI